LNYPIEVKVLTDSISPEGSRMTTFELSYPRFLHGEMNTHRILSRNSQSSRAVTVKKSYEVNSKHVRPIVWGKNKAGMQSTEALKGFRLALAKSCWNVSAKASFAVSRLLEWIGLHKQWANRITEPYSTIKVILTGTEFMNFFWLRQDPDAAQPEMVALADKMRQAYDLSIPVQLKPNQWHIPYVYWEETTEGVQEFFDSNFDKLTEEQALKISASCCAQVSYRALNDSREKAMQIYDRLFSGTKQHLSPTEHQGKVMEVESLEKDLPPCFMQGVTALNNKGKYLSGNLQGFIQYRQLLDKQGNQT
jgi:thymidylate synthase ThyX